MKKHRWKFKTDKTVCSKSQPRTTYGVTKNKTSVYPESKERESFLDNKIK